MIAKVHSCVHGKAPGYLCSKFRKNLNAQYRETRGVNNLQQQCPHTNFYRNSFEFSGAKLWNNLPHALKEIKSERMFRSTLKGHLS